MQAVIYTEYGPPDVLKVAEISQLQPEATQIRVRVRAVAINFGDLIARNFASISMRDFGIPAALLFPARLEFGWQRPRKPILGSQFAGDVEAVGADVTGFNEGDAVFGYLGQTMGGYAEYLCIAEDGLVAHKPENISYEQASAIPYGALTALSLLQRMDIQAGKKVLINGASGSIGSAAVQLAKYYGAHVTGVCGRLRMEYVRALGADVVLDYVHDDFTQMGKRYDLIFDVMNKRTFAECKGSLTPDGRYLLANFKMAQIWQMLWTRFTSRQKVICALSSERAEDLRYIKTLMKEGHLTAIVDRCYPLARTAEAHQYAESGQKRGSIIITPEEAHE